MISSPRTLCRKWARVRVKKFLYGKKKHQRLEVYGGEDIKLLK